MRKIARLVVAFAAAGVMVTCGFYWYLSYETLPSEIRIAAGKQDGLYYKLADKLSEHLRKRNGRPAYVIETAGTEANLELLRNGEAELALIQTVSLTPEGIAGVAPLLPEPLHFIVRKGSGITSPKELKDHRVALGPKGSTMRQTAYTFLAHYGVTGVRDDAEYFGSLATDLKVDAALVTTGWMNPKLEKLLQRDDLELIAISDPEGLATRYPWFTAMTIPRGLYAGKSPAPPEPVRTVAVTALLASRSDATDRLVREALAALYESDLRSAFPAVLSAKAAKDFDSAVMHSSVANYHDPSAGLNRLTHILEFVSKSKEAAFGVIAFCLLIWSWVRRRREQVAEAADRAQRQKLDDFIGRTLTVELEQMDVSEPELLRPFLRKVTHIKQEALRELTSEKVRGDQLFAIFLSQCAALSEKIQMRMLYGRMTEEVEQGRDAGPQLPGSPKT